MAHRGGSWDLVTGMLVDDVRRTLTVLTVAFGCFAVGLVVLALVSGDERAGALFFALVMAVLAAVCGGLRAAVVRWRHRRGVTR